MLLVISSNYVGTGNGGSKSVNFTLADHGIATHLLTFICSHYNYTYIAMRISL